MKSKLLKLSLLVLIVLMGVDFGFAQWKIRPRTVVKTSATDTSLLINYGPSAYADTAATFYASYVTASTDTVKTLFAYNGGQGYLSFTPKRQYFATNPGWGRFYFHTNDTIYLSFTSRTGYNQIRGANNGLPWFRFDNNTKCTGAIVDTTNALLLWTQSGLPKWRVASASSARNAAGDSANVQSNSINWRKYYNFSQDTLALIYQYGNGNYVADSTGILYLSNLKVRVARLGFWVAGAKVLAGGNLFQPGTATYNGVTDTLIAKYGQFNTPDDMLYGANIPANMLAAKKADSGFHTSMTVQKPGGGFWETNCVDSTNALEVGAPIAVFQLLPGKANFVRWNIGINPGSSTVLARFDGAGKIRPTDKRSHFRGRVSVTHGAGGMGSWTPFKTTDSLNWTVDSNNTAAADTKQWLNFPDTMYVFDKDSNLTTYGLSASTYSFVPVDSAYGAIANYANYLRDATPTYTSGRYIFTNYNYTELMTLNSNSTQRVKKLRFVGNVNISGLTVSADTMNSVNDGLVAIAGLYTAPTSFGYAICQYYKGYIDNIAGADTTINVGPGVAEKALIEWKITGGTFQQTWPVSILASQRSPVTLRATMRDRFNNIINKGAIGMSQAGAPVGTNWAFSTAGTYGDPVANDGTGATSNRATTSPITAAGTWIYVAAYNNYAGAYYSTTPDRGGMASADLQFNCSGNAVDSAFISFKTVDDTSAAASTWINPLTFGGSGTIYKITVNPDTTPSTIQLWATYGSSTRVPAVTYFSVPTTSNQRGDRNSIDLYTIFNDACGKSMTMSSTNRVTFTSTFSKTGVHEPLNPAPFTKYYPSQSKAGLPGFTAQGYASTLVDSLGTLGTATIGSDNNVHIPYTVPFAVADTILLKATFTTNGIYDQFYVVTVSGPPAYALVTRPYVSAWTDSIQLASRGTSLFTGVPTMSTFDPYGYTVDFTTYGANTGVVWRLYGATRYSASIRDAWTGATTFRGRRQIVRPAYTTDFNANGTTVTVVTDTVGGAAYRNTANSLTTTTVYSTVTPASKDLVYPVEKDGVFPAESYTLTTDAISGQSYPKVTGTYAWTSTDTTWNAAKTFGPGVPSATTKKDTTVTQSATTERGWNKLDAFVVWNGNPVKATYLEQQTNAVNANMVFFTLPDTTSANLRLAWLDGPSFLGLQNSNNTSYYSDANANVPALYKAGQRVFNGRGVAPATTVTNDATTNWLDGATRTVVDTSYTVSGPVTYKNYAGQVDSMFLRVFDIYGNPVNTEATSTVWGTEYNTFGRGDSINVTIEAVTGVRFALINPYSATWGPDSANGVFWGTGNNWLRANRTATKSRDQIFQTSGLNRGAYLVHYQTLFATSATNYNIADNVTLKATLYTAAAPWTAGYVDRAVIKSIATPTTGNVTVSTYSTQAVDTVNRAPGQGINVGIQSTNSGLLANQKKIWWVNSNLSGLPYKVVLDSTSVNPTNPNAPITDMAGFNVLTSTVDAASAWGNSNPTQIANSLSFGGSYVSGGAIMFKSYRAGDFYLSVMDTVAGTKNPITNASGNKVKFTFNVGKVHYSTLTNPTSGHIDYEPSFTSVSSYNDLVPGPLRPDYFSKGGKWDPYGMAAGTLYSTLGGFNGAVTNNYLLPYGPNNPRNYSPGTVANMNVPRDTVFYNENGYQVPLKYHIRLFDRWGNRIYNTPIYLRAQSQPGEVRMTTNYQTDGTGNDEQPIWNDSTGLAAGRITSKNIADTMVAYLHKLDPAQTADSAYTRIYLYYSSAEKNAAAVGGVTPTGLHDLPAGAIGQKFVVAYRDLYVKMLKAPGAFTINDVTRLARIDNPSAATVWTPSWTQSASTNFVDDQIRYTLTAIAYKADGTTENIAMATSLNALSFALDSTTLVTKLGLNATTPNRTIKWFVTAANKWNLTTTSTLNPSADVVIELNQANSAPTLTAVTNTVVVSKSTDQLTLGWSQPTDLNGIFNTPKVVKNYYSKDYTLDTLSYQVSLDTVRTSNFAPITAVLPYVKADTAQYTTLTATELLSLLGTNDSALIKWTVKAKDRSTASWTNAITSAEGTFLLTRINNTYYMYVTADKGTPPVLGAMNDTLTLAVTDIQQINITAYDGVWGDTYTDVIRGFNKVTDGTTTPSVKLRILGMGATTDALQTREITYVNGSGATVAASVDQATGLFSIPASAFANGVATMFFQDKRAYDIVKVSVQSNDNQTMFKLAGRDGGKSPLIKLNNSDTTIVYKLIPGTIAKVKTTVPARKSAKVFLKKKMEVVIEPVDLYNNTVTTWTKIGIWVMADPADDFDETMGVNVYRLLDRNTSPDPYPDGKYYAYITPNRVHNIPGYNALKVGGLLADNSGLPMPTTGSMVQVLVENHMPYIQMTAAEIAANKGDTTTFVVTDPTGADVTNAEVALGGYTNIYKFNWRAATDTNDRPLVPSYPVPAPPSTWFNDQCIVKYNIKFKEWPSFQVLNISDTGTTVQVTAAQLKSVFEAKYGVNSLDKKASRPLYWYVTLEDDVYQISMPAYANILKTGYKMLRLKDGGITSVDKEGKLPTVYGLDQNFPNPFNPTTNISYALPKESNVKLVIYNILGQPVRTLVNERQSAGFVNMTWDGKDDRGTTVSTGVYIYKLTAGDFTSIKKMNLLK